MDAPHINAFGNFKFAHVCVDSLSGFIYTTTQTHEPSLLELFADTY